MDYIDYNTLPEGFDLRADTILGFSQQGLIDAVNGLAKLGNNGNCIISGCGIVGNTVADGWVFYNGELFRFVGGVKQDNCIVVNNVIQKANQGGVLVDRVYRRYVTFGSGTGQFPFSSLFPINTLRDAQFNDVYIAGHGYPTGGWCVLGGFAPLANGLNSGTVLYNGERITPGSYNGGPVESGSPVYLTRDGNWTTAASGAHLKFDPYTEKIQERYTRNAVHPVGSAIWLVSTSSELTGYFPSGLGKWKWLDWAIADGTNGTVDLSGEITGLTAVQRIN